MTDDIVTRLRLRVDPRIVFPDKLSGEAADEIERLRTELAEANRVLGALDPEAIGEGCAVEIRGIRAEPCDAYGQTATTRENTRLRAAVEKARAAAQPTPNGEPLRGRVLVILLMLHWLTLQRTPTQTWNVPDDVPTALSPTPPNDGSEQMSAAQHAEHVTVMNAYWVDCLEGECEHRDEDGQPEDMSACTPVPPFEVCVDCMDEAGRGRNPENWDDVALAAWPHPVSTSSGSEQ